MRNPLRELRDRYDDLPYDDEDEPIDYIPAWAEVPMGQVWLAVLGVLFVVVACTVIFG